MMTASEHDRKVAFRHWSIAAKLLREAVDKMVMVAHDEGQITSDAFELFSTSCMAKFASTLAYTCTYTHTFQVEC